MRLFKIHPAAAQLREQIRKLQPERRSLEPNPISNSLKSKARRYLCHPRPVSIRSRGHQAVARRRRAVAWNIEYVEKVSLYAQLHPLLDGEALKYRRVASPQVRAEDRLVDPRMQRTAGGVPVQGDAERRGRIGYRQKNEIQAIKNVVTWWRYPISKRTLK